MLSTCPSQRLLEQTSDDVLIHMQAPEPAAEAGSAAQPHGAAAEPAPPSTSEPASATIPAAHAATAKHADDEARPDDAVQPAAPAEKPKEDRAKVSEAGSNAGKLLVNYSEPRRERAQSQLPRQGMCIFTEAKCPSKHCTIIVNLQSILRKLSILRSLHSSMLGSK